MTLRLVAIDGDMLPPHRPADLNRLRLVGQHLGEALDAGQLPVTRAAEPGRLIDVLQEPKPLVVWAPTRWQLACRKVRRWFGRFG